MNTTGYEEYEEEISCRDCASEVRVNGHRIRVIHSDRWRTGPDRPCADHGDERNAAAAAAAELGITMTAGPGEHDGGGRDGGR